MAFNKSKALESALKYLNQGKVAQAITEYQQILRHDPKDQATLMTVGDLYARQGDMPHAVEYFERLAQVYLTDGFNSKAIAIYKKIAKLAPNELAPLERLADLYVQQGVLSEARPLFLQIAEVHLKANHSQKAVEVLQRLLDVEPDNPRVQMRLAELYNVMGQKKEAAHTYLSYAQRLLDHGETDEGLKLVDRALELEPGNATALLLKGKSLASGKKTDEAIKVLSAHPDANAGGELTDLIFGMQMESGNLAGCLDRARKELARGHAHFGALLRVTDAYIDKGETEKALELLRELREPMIEAGEQDKFLKSLTAITERTPNDAEPLEMLVDFCRHTSDPFRLNGALGQLADLYAGRGEYGRAVELLEELADRNKEDERVQQRLAQMRARAGGAPAPVEPPPAPVLAPEPVVGKQSQTAPAEQSFSEQPVPAPERNFGREDEELEAGAPAPIVAENLDEETQRYVAQALTDADLFSSYGLTQKATVLLENVLQRAPRHTPSLERLLDLYLGAGNERRTAEMAALLEQIHRQRDDTTNADRFAEMRKRFQKVAGIPEAELPVAPPAPSAPEPAPAPVSQVSAAPVVHAAPPVQTAAPVEFEIPLAAPEAEPEQAASAPPAAPQEFKIEAPVSAPEPAQAPAAPVEPVSASAVPSDREEAVEELDLSDEWDAMSRETEQASSPEPEAAIEPEEPVAPQVPVASQAPAASQAKAEQPEPAVHAEPVEFDIAPSEEIELIEEAPEPAAAEPEPISAPPVSTAPVNGAAPRKATPAPAPAASKEPPQAPLTTDDFIRELVAEIEHSGPQDPVEAPETAEAAMESFAPPEPEPEPVEAAEEIVLDLPVPAKPASKAKVAGPVQPAKPVQAVEAANAGALDELAGIFQEFRDELGEMESEDEDLETHYNLGIAYREMGLLDEGVSEFQRVAKAVQKGNPFPYAMNCATLLALCFMDKQQPNIAVYWYQRALETPGIDQEAELALRYDLGVAQETAGQSKSALSSFQQVYAMNIDYRDVADRIASLQKHAPV
ncbi:MAG: tetratricopeptide repeat protein [Candidatus Acidiferrales bacterium]